MSKAAVVYWSGTGNTEAMAGAVAEGVRLAGSEADLIAAGDFDGGMLADYDAFAFGCPAMGEEALEEAEFEPMFAGVEGKLGEKKTALFGSFGWGDGEWMRSWEERCRDRGIGLACAPVTCAESPDAAALAACRELGKALVRDSNEE